MGEPCEHMRYPLDCGLCREEALRATIERLTAEHAQAVASQQAFMERNVALERMCRRLVKALEAERYDQDGLVTEDGERALEEAQRLLEGRRGDG